MNRGLPFLIVGLTFLTIAFVSLATGDRGMFTVWIAVGTAMLGVGIALSQSESDEDDEGRSPDDSTDTTDPADPKRA